jgi:hypothetical protein
MEIFAHTGVPALEYDISLPCGMRRKALPIRNGLREGGNNVKYREAKVVQLQRDHDRVECRRQHHLKTQKEDRQQKSAKAKKQRRGGGVCAKLNEGSTIARNREHWANICGKNTRQRGDQGSTPQAEREQERGPRVTPTEEEPSNNNDDDKLARRRARENTRHEPPTTNSPHDKVMGGGGARRGAPASGRGQNYEEDETDGQRPWELCN